MTTVLNKSIQRRWKQKADIFRVELAGTERVSHLGKQRRINVCELISVAYIWMLQSGSMEHRWEAIRMDILHSHLISLIW